MVNILDTGVRMIEIVDCRPPRRAVDGSSIEKQLLNYFNNLAEIYNLQSELLEEIDRLYDYLSLLNKDQKDKRLDTMKKIRKIQENLILIEIYFENN
jgi:hypothetical protein